MTRIAFQEGVDYLGFSVHSGAHLEYLGSLKKDYSFWVTEGNDLNLLAGGIISEEDEKKLKESGFAEIFPSGTPKARLGEIKKFFDSRKINGGERIRWIKDALAPERKNCTQDFISFNPLLDWRRGLALLISELANGTAEAYELVDGLPDIKTRDDVKILTIGVTGPLGVGKSSLTDKLIAEFMKRGKRVGVITIDPSDHVSGGALLGGDRTQMWRHTNNTSAHIYSMASRDCHNGIAAATPAAVKAMRAAGYDIVIVETIGVGQDQVGIKNIADKTLLVLTPDVGEDQVYKSGIMQIADAYVINKADLLDTKPLETALNKMLDEKSLYAGGKGRPLIFKVTANKDENNGVKELVDELLK
ncbi:MAG: GTP-binding protein [Patescibacteria group bacterium]